MKKKLFQKAICLILSVTTLFGVMAFSASAAGSDDGLRGTNRDTASSLEEMKDLVGVSSYDEYLAEYGDNYTPGLPVINVDLTDVVSGSNGVKPSDSAECQNAFQGNQSNWAGFGDNWSNSIYLPSQGSTTWNVTVPDGAASYYHIRIHYYSCITGESSTSSIERKLLIDGKTPFDESKNITLSKSWVYDNVDVVGPVDTTEPDGVTTKTELKDDGYYKIVTVIKDGKKTVNSYKIAQDLNGNSMSPEIIQSPSWNTYYCQDSTGYYQGYFRFYFSNGNHQITLSAEREPVIVKSIELVPYEKDTNGMKTYADVVKEYQEKGYKPAKVTDPKKQQSITVIQAEFPDLVSDASVYPTNDNTSPATYPSVSKAQLYNVIGENSYNSVGQWAAYKFRVNATGLYKIGMRYLQSALQGMYVCRTIKLAGGQYGLEDGTPEVPFAEAYDAQFDYSKEWQSDFIGDSNGNVFEFYFEEGVEYTLYIECSLGSLKDLIQRVENSLAVINDCYLSILKLTGSSPDEYRDYDFEKIIPQVLNSLLAEAQELMAVKEALRERCGTNGSHIVTLETVAKLLAKMGADDGYEVAANMSNLKTYLGTLGTWINSSKTSTMILDSISVCPSDTAKKQLPAAKENFFKSLWFEITSFIYSFFIDYEAMGVTKTVKDDVVTIDVWLALGRDQSNIWRTMIDADSSIGFTQATGYAVNLKLVTAGTLLPSILSGKGPDIYMGLDSASVINYAIRNAVVAVNDSAVVDSNNNQIFNTTYYTYVNKDGSYEVVTEERPGETPTFVSEKFEDYVDANFVEAAMDTLTLGNYCYGLPQQMSFTMMFYRMDVLAELGQEVPETWSQLLAMLPALQSNNMSMGISYVLALDFMLYQKGGNMWKYTDDPDWAGAQIGLDSNIAIESFQYVTRLYSDYSFPVAYDAANRFRTGEMPILVGDYVGLYNQLIVYATEIDGLWEFCPLPGCEREDGTVNYDSLATITATVMLHGCEGEEQFAAWEYMQWQTSADVQAEYGNKMVALIGPSAKYATANINAIKNLSWTADEREAILDQIEHMSSIVNYPGSYYIARYVQFAFLDVVNDGVDASDALTSYISAINTEITRKRQEFGLNTWEGDELPPGYKPGTKQ
jgi:ABC-type glycerol-3-phosphate transport system substrate-binding protein